VTATKCTVLGCQHDVLAAELARCRAANVYDANAHRRVSELEAALRKYGRHIERPNLCRAVNFFASERGACTCGFSDFELETEAK
jgi:hypothetical protein